MHLLVIVHIYYEDLWPELADVLSFLPGPFDLRVTCVRDAEGISSMVHERFPLARVEQVENRGFDMGPFFHVLNSVRLEDYDAVVKLHTKRDIPPHYVMRVDVSGPKFRELLLSFAAGGERWQETLDRLFRQGTCMVGEGKLALNRFSDSLRDYDAVKAVMRRAGLSFRGGFFVAGSMFIVRAPLLKPFQGRFRLEDFDVSDRSQGDCLPHFLERALGYAVYAQGYRLSGWDGRPFALAAVAWRAGRFFFPIHHGSHHDIYRICGIPVWYRKNRKD